jgi:hypothetical protein
MGLEKIVNVQIERQTAGVTQAGFGIPLILGPNAPGGVRAYSGIAAVGEDFSTTDVEYLMAQKIFSQNPKLPTVKIGELDLEAKIVTITPDVTIQEVFEYEVTINGELFSFESSATPNATDVVAGLLALINASSQPVTASGTTTLILTADNDGQNFTVALGDRLSQVVTNENQGVADNINSAIEEDNDWYFLLLTDVSEYLVRDAAAAIEALYKMFIFRNNDADVRTTSTSDLASELKDAGFFRTAMFYQSNLSDYGDAGFIGRCAPLDNLDVQTATWANKTIAGVSVDNWTDTEQANLDNKNVNYYVQIAGVNVTLNGKVLGGEYIDIIRFIDWLRARMQERIFLNLVTKPKIPFTDPGIISIEANIREILERGVSVGGITDSQSYSVSVPKASQVPLADKQARILRNVTFEAQLAGAIHAVEINGVVTL